METMQFVLYLTAVPGIGDRTVAAILRRNAITRRTPEEFLRLSPYQWKAEYGLTAGVAGALNTGCAARAAGSEETARRLRRAGVWLWTQQESLYPARLAARMETPPAYLFAYGNVELLKAPLFALANSNGAPESALAACDTAAATLLSLGGAPVTGHNRTAYQRAALAARRTGGRVCYVLDRGLLEAFGEDLTRELFPAARIWSAAYDPACDLTLSPFAPRDHGLAANNRRRDGMIFALADVIVTGWIRPGGRMEAACLRALAQGRPVLLARPPDESHAGLLQAGATPCAPDAKDRMAAFLHPFQPAPPQADLSP